MTIMMKYLLPGNGIRRKISKGRNDAAVAAALIDSRIKYHFYEL